VTGLVTALEFFPAGIPVGIKKNPDRDPGMWGRCIGPPGCLSSFTRQYRNYSEGGTAPPATTASCRLAGSTNSTLLRFYVACGFGAQRSLQQSIDLQRRGSVFMLCHIFYIFVLLFYFYAIILN